MADGKITYGTSGSAKLNASDTADKLHSESEAVKSTKTSVNHGDDIKHIRTTQQTNQSADSANRVRIAKINRELSVGKISENYSANFREAVSLNSKGETEKKYKIKINGKTEEEIKKKKLSKSIKKGLKTVGKIRVVGSTAKNAGVSGASKVRSVVSSSGNYANLNGENQDSSAQLAEVTSKVRAISSKTSQATKKVKSASTKATLKVVSAPVKTAKSIKKIKDTPKNIRKVKRTAKKNIRTVKRTAEESIKLTKKTSTAIAKAVQSIVQLVIKLFTALFGAITAISIPVILAFTAFLGFFVLIFFIFAGQNVANQSSKSSSGLDANALRVMNCLVQDEGFSIESAAAIYVTIGWEVGYDNLNAEGASSVAHNSQGTFYGVMSLQGSYDSPPSGLVAFATERGTTWDDFDTQIAYIAERWMLGMESDTMRQAWIGTYNSEYYNDKLTDEENKKISELASRSEPLTLDEFKGLDNSSVAHEIYNEMFEHGYPLQGMETYYQERDGINNAIEYMLKKAKEVVSAYNNRGAGGGSTLAAIAQQELGNYGDTYCQWYYNSNEMEDWCCIFVSWCVNKAGLTDEIPKCSGCTTLIDGLVDQANVKGNDFTPSVGDLITFRDYSDGKARHIAIVTKVDNGTVYYIGGNQAVGNIDRNSDGEPDANQGKPFCTYSTVSESSVTLGSSDIYKYYHFEGANLGEVSSYGLVCPIERNNISSVGTYADHRATDIVADLGTPVYASASGTVVDSSDYCTYCYQGSEGNTSYGRYIKIDHGNGTYTAYAHLNERVVEIGDTVTQGQLIGYVGETGNAYGTHLHFEVYINGYRQDDPRNYVTILPRE